MNKKQLLKTLILTSSVPTIITPIVSIAKNNSLHLKYPTKSAQYTKYFDLTSISDLLFNWNISSGSIRCYIPNDTTDDVVYVGANKVNFIANNLIFPETVYYNNKNYTVVGIVDGGFSNLETVTGELKFNKTIHEIGIDAFKNCSSITTINIPSNIDTIGSNAFSYIESLNTINVDCTLSSPVNTFLGCINLTDVTFNGSVSCPNNIFKLCHNIKNISFNNAINFEKNGWTDESEDDEYSFLFDETDFSKLTTITIGPKGSINNAGRIFANKNSDGEYTWKIDSNTKVYINGSLNKCNQTFNCEDLVNPNATLGDGSYTVGSTDKTTKIETQILECNKLFDFTDPSFNQSVILNSIITLSTSEYLIDGSSCLKQIKQSVKNYSTSSSSSNLCNGYQIQGSDISDTYGKTLSFCGFTSSDHINTNKFENEGNTPYKKIIILGDLNSVSDFLSLSPSNNIEEIEVTGSLINLDGKNRFLTNSNTEFVFKNLKSLTVHGNINNCSNIFNNENIGASSPINVVVDGNINGLKNSFIGDYKGDADLKANNIIDCVDIFNDANKNCYLKNIEINNFQVSTSGGSDSNNVFTITPRLLKFICNGNIVGVSSNILLGIGSNTSITISGNLNNCSNILNYQDQSNDGHTFLWNPSTLSIGGIFNCSNVLNNFTNTTTVNVGKINTTTAQISNSYCFNNINNTNGVTFNIYGTLSNLEINEDQTIFGGTTKINSLNIYGGLDSCTNFLNFESVETPLTINISLKGSLNNNTDCLNNLKVNGSSISQFDEISYNNNTCNNITGLTALQINETFEQNESCFNDLTNLGITYFLKDFSSNLYCFNGCSSLSSLYIQGNAVCDDNSYNFVENTRVREIVLGKDCEEFYLNNILSSSIKQLTLNNFKKTIEINSKSLNSNSKFSGTVFTNYSQVDDYKKKYGKSIFSNSSILSNSNINTIPSIKLTKDIDTYNSENKTDYSKVATVDRTFFMHNTNNYGPSGEYHYELDSPQITEDNETDYVFESVDGGKNNKLTIKNRLVIQLDTTNYMNEDTSLPTGGAAITWSWIPYSESNDEDDPISTGNLPITLKYVYGTADDTDVTHSLIYSTYTFNLKIENYQPIENTYVILAMAFVLLIAAGTLTRFIVLMKSKKIKKLTSEKNVEDKEKEVK